MFSCGVIGIAFVHVVFNRQLFKHGFFLWDCCQFFTHPRAVLGILTGFSPAAFSHSLSGSPYVSIIYYRRFSVKVFSLFLPLIPKLIDSV